MREQVTKIKTLDDAKLFLLHLLLRMEDDYWNSR